MGHGVDGQFSFEVKTTRNSHSQLELTPLGQAANTATLRIARIGDSIITLYQLPDQQWIVHRRYARPDMPETLQLGLVTYSDWSKASDFDPFVHNSTVLQAGVNDPTPNEPFNPDLVAGFEYARFARPQVPPEIEGLDLVNLATDQQLISFLGDPEVTEENTPPQIATIADQSIVVDSQPLVIDLVASDADGDSLTYHVNIGESLATQIMAAHNLHEMPWRDDYALNWGGQQEKWLQGNQGWYFLLPDGTLNVWGGDFPSSTQLAVLSVAEYEHPDRLLLTPDAEIVTEIINGQLVISPGSQTGSFDIEVVVSDGIASDHSIFTLELINTAPVFSIGDQTAMAGQLTIQLPATDADGHAVTYTAEVLGDQLSVLDAEHGFWSDGNDYTNYLGQHERWIRDSANRWHYILPDGDLHRWEGSFATSPLVAELGSDIYQMPSRLTDPQPTPVTATVENGVLWIASSSGYVGEVNIRITASDGYQSVSDMFLVSFIDELVDDAFATWD